MVRSRTGLERGTASLETGRFLLNSLPPGLYELRCEKDGFSATVFSDVQVFLGQSTVQNIRLTLATVAGAIEVSESVEALQSTATTGGAVLGGERVEEAPAPNRSYLNFVLVAPGVLSSSGSNTNRSMAGLRNVNNDSGFVFSGLRGRNNSILIDGADNRDETTGASRVAVGLEMIAEFRAASTNLNTEFGGAAGGTVNLVTRPGTDLWHGDATFFLQNQLLNARNPEVEIPQKNRFRRYQPGASLLGPLKRNRTYFATAFEQNSESSDEWSDASRKAIAVINPLLSTPAFARAGTKSLTRGLFRTGEYDAEAFFKLNHQIDARNALMIRHAFSRGKIRADVQAVDNFSDLSARGNSLLQDNSTVAAWTSVPNPNLVNDLRFQFAVRQATLTPNGQGPLYEIPGIISFGAATKLDSDRTERHIELGESLQIVRQHHTLSLGATAHWVHLDARIANRFGGAFVFPTLEDFTAGKPDLYIQAFGNPQTTQSTLPFGTWFQERWQAGHGFTVEAGLRFDRQRMPQGLPSSTNNFAPRLGLAWHPSATSPWVVRAAAGLFYDRFLLGFLNNGLQQGDQYLTGSLAQMAFAQNQGGALAVPLAGLPLSRYTFGSNLPSTYSRKLILGIERRIDKDTTATLELSNVHGLHLPRTRNTSGTLPPAWQLEQSSSSKYQGASITLQRRLRNEFTYLVAYNLSKTRDDASDFDEQPLNPLNPRQDWSRSRQHQTHRVAASGLLELNEGIFDNIIIAPVFSYGSARPLNPLLSSDVYRTGAWPISARPLGVSRNSAFMPPTFSLDLRVMKTFPIHNNRSRLQIGIESFNLLNHTNFSRANPYVAASFGKAVELAPSRQIQLMTQFEF